MLHARALPSDTEGIRTPAGRAQWISSPSPEPLGHAVRAKRLAGKLCAVAGANFHPDACPVFPGRSLLQFLLCLSSTHLLAFALSGHLKLLGRRIPSLALSRCARQQASCGIRTHDLPLTERVLCQLS